MVHSVYILREKEGKRTYVGYTNNLERRIRQHNNEIKGGAKYTKGRDWEYAGYISGFNDNILALQCEWKLKHPGVNFGSGMKGRIKSLEHILGLEKFTSNSLVMNKDMILDLFLRKEYMDIKLSENIKILELI